MPGRSFSGAHHAQAARAAGLEIREPSIDARVLEFTWSIPDEIFREPATDTDRWLIRQAMKGRLPDDVRLSRRFGRQAGDLPIRLRQSSEHVEAALAQVEDSDAACSIVDPVRLRAAWRVVSSQDTRDAYRQSVSILTRGLMVGIFVAEQF